MLGNSLDQLHTPHAKADVGEGIDTSRQCLKVKANMK
jgi:hypothetical protein